MTVLTSTSPNRSRISQIAVRVVPGAALLDDQPLETAG
jgi:hypothetical protein